MRRTFERFFLSAADAREFFHQIGLRRKSSRCIGDNHIHAAGPAGIDGIKNHRCRITSSLCNNFDAVAFTPDGELLPCGSTESITGG